MVVVQAEPEVPEDARIQGALSSRMVSGLSGFGTRKDVLVTTSTERALPQQLQVPPQQRQPLLWSIG